MTVEERRIRDVVVIALKGKLTLGEGVTRLKDKINSVLLEGFVNIVIDLGDVSYIDSGGLGQLVSTFTSVTRSRGTLKLVRVGRRAHSLLAVTRLLTVFDAYDTEKEAIDSFRPVPVVAS